MVTIKDIAKIAGVSVTTVSKVINDYPDIGEKTKARVLKIIDQENYRPNAIARSLSTNKSNTIGIFITDHSNYGIRHPVFRDIIYAIEKTFFDREYDVIIFAHRWGDRYGYTDKCLNRNVDGTVLMGMPRTDPGIDELIKSKIPSVFIDIDIVGRHTSYVISDNVEGAKKAVDYLYSLGHEKIGMVMGQWTTKPAQDRLIGFQQKKEELKLDNNNDWIIETEFSEKGGFDAMTKLLSLKDIPTAVFCQSDEMAIGAMKAIKKQGYKVPDDFSIIGFDDIEISKYIRPAITTIRQDKMEMGEKAAELLLKIMAGDNESHFPVIMPVSLIERESCKKNS